MTNEKNKLYYYDIVRFHLELVINTNHALANFQKKLEITNNW